MTVCNKPRGLLMAILCLFSTGLGAETRLELEETQITGARELPKVLYIVPWRPSPPRLERLSPRSLLQQPLQPLDRDVFRRYGRYRTMLPAASEGIDSP